VALVFVFYWVAGWVAAAAEARRTRRAVTATRVAASGCEPHVDADAA
jgi:hypothetical protein